MQSDVAETIYERVKELPLEKQKEILEQIQAIADSEAPSIWEKLRAHTEHILDEDWEKLPVDGAEQHDHYLYGTPK